MMTEPGQDRRTTTSSLLELNKHKVWQGINKQLKESIIILNGINDRINNLSEKLDEYVNSLTYILSNDNHK